MLSRRERALVHVLLWTAAAAALVLFGYSRISGRAEASNSIARMEQQLLGFEQRGGSASDLNRCKQKLEAELAGLRSRFYGEGEMDLYGFGASVRDLLLSSGLAISRYQTLETGGRTYLEFAVSGSAHALVSFLLEVSGRSKYWSIPYLSVNARGGGASVQALFRIGYEQIAGSSD